MPKRRTTKLLLVTIVLVGAGLIALLTFASCRLLQAGNGKNNPAQAPLKNKAADQDATSAGNGKNNPAQGPLKNKAADQEATSKEVEFQPSDTKQPEVKQPQKETDMLTQETTELKTELEQLRKAADDLTKDSDLSLFHDYLIFRQSIQDADNAVFEGDDKVFPLLEKKMETEKARLEALKSDSENEELVTLAEILYSILSASLDDDAQARHGE